jgi:tryptophan synthase alpha chain
MTNGMTNGKALLLALAVLALGGAGYGLFQLGGFGEFSSGIASACLLMALVLAWTASYLFRVVSGQMTFIQQRRQYRQAYDAFTTEALQRKFDALSPEEQERLLRESGQLTTPPPDAVPAAATPIELRFSALRQQGRCALMPFLMAGDPDLAATRACLLALQANGADLVELGIPYSDPLADGPVIQAAASRALKARTTPAGVLEMLSSLKGELTMPVVLFTYSNPLLNRGMEAFCAAAAAAGAAGLVVPDLPLEEAEKLSAIAAAAGLDLVLLVARTNLESRVGDLVGQLKTLGDTPIAVGFGISGPEQARQVRDWGADGAIVGSALVKVMEAAHGQQGDVAAAAGRFCAELRAGLDA